MPLSEFLRYLATKTGVSVVADAGLSEKGVTLDLKDQPTDEVLESVTRHLGVQLHKHSETLYFVGELRPEDNAVLVRRVRVLSGSELKAALGPTLSGANAIATFPDGLIVISDRAPVIQRAARMLDQLETMVAPTWAVQLYFVTFAKGDLVDLGLDVEPAFNLGVTYSTASAIGQGGRLDVGLSALLEAVEQRSSSSLVAQPFFLMRDGSEANYRQVRSVPVATTQVSQETGNRTLVGFTTVEAGTIVNVGIREQSQNAVLLKLDAELSEILSVNDEGAPDAQRQTIQSETVVYSGGVYLVGAVEIVRKRKGRGAWLHPGSSSEDVTEVLQVWARAVSIDSQAGMVK